MKRMFKTNTVIYNNLSMIMLNLPESIAYFADWKNMNEFEAKNIEVLKEKAKELGVKSILFIPNQVDFIDGLWNQDNLDELAFQYGVDGVYQYMVHPMLKQMTWEQLYENIYNFMNIKYVMVDEYFQDSYVEKFNTKELKNNWGDDCFINNNYSKKPDNNTILNMLKESDFDLFEESMQLPYMFTSRVVEGEKLGRTIGFPTANLSVDNKIPLDHGVYAVDIRIDHDGRHFLGAGCYWINKQGQDVFETHILGFDEEIYGQSVTIKPIQKIRNNKKVNGIDELKSMLEKDVEMIKEFEYMLNIDEEEKETE